MENRVHGEGGQDRRRSCKDKYCFYIQYIPCCDFQAIPDCDGLPIF